MNKHVMLIAVFAISLAALSACTAYQADDLDPGAGHELVVGEVSQALAQPVDSVTLNITADTSIRSLQPNKNFGSASSLDINRGLVIVDQDTLMDSMPEGDYVLSAKLRFTLVPTLLPRLQRNLSVHRVLKPWTEAGATWNCAIDANPGNISPDCSGETKWSMTSSVDAFVSTASGSTVIPSSRSGVVEVDVTEDVRNFKNDPHILNYGWILKTNVGNGSEVADIASSESATPPQLVMSIRRCSLEVCDDGITCSQDGFCSSVGECFKLTAPPISPCSDDNACTVNDHCSGMDFECIPGSPAPEGTACGSGLACDGAGECVPTP